MPAICSRPMRCSPGRPRSTMSPSASRSRARRASRRCSARRAGSRRSASARSATAIRICCPAGSASGSGLAQVLIRDPKILLMDEPFGPLDAQTRQIMGNLLLELWNADRKAVLVRHPRSRRGDRARRPRGDHVGGARARIIGDWRVSLPRPRDIFEVRLEKEFHSLHREIWSVLKDEVLKGYAQSATG